MQKILTLSNHFGNGNHVYRGYEKLKLITRLKNIKTTSRGFKAENEKKKINL